jgi:hypothetical protein
VVINMLEAGVTETSATHDQGEWGQTYGFCG